MFALIGQYAVGQWGLFEVLVSDFVGRAEQGRIKFPRNLVMCQNEPVPFLIGGFLPPFEVIGFHASQIADGEIRKAIEFGPIGLECDFQYFEQSSKFRISFDIGSLQGDIFFTVFPIGSKIKKIWVSFGKLSILGGSLGNGYKSQISSRVHFQGRYFV